MAATAGSSINESHVLAALREHGTVSGAARHLGMPRSTLREHIGRSPKLADAVPARTQALPEPEAAGLTVSGNEAVLTEPPTPRPKLGDVGKLVRERGLDLAEWVVVSTTLNEWDGPLAGGGTQRLKQWKVSLKRKPHLILAAPAVHVPRVKTAVRARKSSVPELIVVEGDHQAPFHDPRLHQASLRALEELHAEHNMVEHVFLGDTGDYPTISKYADHPAAMEPVNKVIQAVYDLLRDKREAAPNARARMLKGNHDWRIEGELLIRAERMYGIRPASIDGVTEIPSLSLIRLLHLGPLGIELVEHPLGWEHGEVELVSGTAGLVVRHGWLTGENTAKRSMLKRGRSLIVGHTHHREHVFQWDPSAEVEREAVVAGTMSRVRDNKFPHFAPLSAWLAGFVTVSRWPSGEFQIEHVRWDGKGLRWRDRRW